MRGRTQSRFAAQLARPMVSAEFAYSTRGALAALGVAAVTVSLLYAFTVWPIATLGWLTAAGLVRFLGRHPIAELFR